MSRSTRFLTFLMIPVLAGCQQTKSANPLSPAIAGPIAGVTITPPRMLEPTNGRSILDTEQPVVPGRRQLDDHRSASVQASDSRSPATPASRAW